jgi:hypothetical protein
VFSIIAKGDEGFANIPDSSLSIHLLEAFYCQRPKAFEFILKVLNERNGITSKMRDYMKQHASDDYETLILGFQNNFPGKPVFFSADIQEYIYPVLLLKWKKSEADQEARRSIRASILNNLPTEISNFLVRNFEISEKSFEELSDSQVDQITNYLFAEDDLRRFNVILKSSLSSRFFKLFVRSFIERVHATPGAISRYHMIQSVLKFHVTWMIFDEAYADPDFHAVRLKKYPYLYASCDALNMANIKIRKFHELLVKSKFEVVEMSFESKIDIGIAIELITSMTSSKSTEIVHRCTQSKLLALKV